MKILSVELECKCGMVFKDYKGILVCPRCGTRTIINLSVETVEEEYDELKAITSPSSRIRVKGETLQWIAKGKVIATMKREEVERLYKELKERKKIGFIELSRKLGDTVKASLLMNYLILTNKAELDRKMPNFNDVIRKREWEIIFKPCME